MDDDWQVSEVIFPRRGPPVWDGRGVSFDYLKASRFDDTAGTVSTAEAATDDDGWSIVSLYYGNGAVLTDLTQPVVLTERASEARGQYIYEVKFQPGYTVNVDALRSDGGIDYRGRARYLVFLDKIVALHPDEDLKIVGRSTLNKLAKYNPFHDELGRFASGDSGGNTIEADIAEATGGGDLVAGAGGAGFGEVSKPLPEGYEVKSSGHNFYIQGPDGVVGHTGGDTAIEAVNLFHQNQAAAAVHAAPAVTIVEPNGLPKGYMVIPNVDEDGDHGGYNVYHNNKLITNVESETVAHAFIAQDVKSSSLSTAAQTLGGFHLSSYNLPAGYTVKPDGTSSGGYMVVGPGGDVHTFGSTASGAVNSYFDAHPQAALPEDHTWVSGNILDSHGNVVYSQIDPSQKPSEAIEEFLNGPKAPTSFSIGAGTHVQGGVAEKPTLGVEHLPKGYKVEEVTTGGYPFKVTNENGVNLGQGDTEKEAIDQFFHSDPSKALPPGYTLDYNPFKQSMAVLDEHGTIVHEHALDQEAGHMPYDTVAAYLAGAPSTFAEVAPTPFVPGEEHLPADVHLNEHAGGYQPVKVISATGEVLGSGSSKEVALHDYFVYHANALLPAGYQVGYDHIADVPIIMDATGKEVYSGDTGQGGYDAAIAYLGQNPGLHGAAAAGETAMSAATVPATQVVPTATNLPTGYKVQESSTEGGHYPFKVTNSNGHFQAGGNTPEEALHSFFDEHPNMALPDGFSMKGNYDTMGTDIMDSSGAVVFTSPSHVHGLDAVVAYMTHEANKEQAVTSTLGTLPETRFGTGAGIGYEPLGEAGLPPGFNVTHERGRGGDFVASTGEPSPPSVHQISADEKQTIYSYTGSGNSAINHFLREDIRPDDPSSVARRIADLDRVFADTATSKDMTLYRGISEKASNKLDKAIAAGGDAHFVDKGFLSTSSSESTAGNWKSGSYVTIEVPKGSKFLDTEHPKTLTSHPGESEWIGARNQHFVITKHEPSKYGYHGTHYTVKLLNFVSKPKDTRQMDLPFVDHGPVNKQDEHDDYDPNDKYIWHENDIEIVPPPEVEKYNDAHDELGRFTETGQGGLTSTESSGTLPTISSEHEQAIGRYTGKNSSDINQYLRFGTQRGDPVEVTADIASLDQVLDQNRTTEDTTVWRSINRDMIKALGKAVDKGQGTFTDKGFTSASRKQRFASIRDVGYVTIELPKGSAALDVKPWSRKPEEDETLIARNQTYAARRDPSDAKHFILKLVPGVDKVSLLYVKVSGEIDDKFVWDAGDVVFLAVKWNPFHDIHGLFSSGSGTGTNEHGSTGSAEASATAINELISPHGIEAQREAVSDYTDEGYLDVNNLLRHGEEPAFPTSTASVIKHLDELLKTASLDKETTVYRGISKSGAKRFDEAIASGNTTFVDKGFLSTTRDQHYATVFAASMKHSHAIVDIILPKGSHALDIATWSSSPDEQETLVQRGSAFKIEGKTVDNDTNAPIYKVRLLSNYDPQQLDLFHKRAPTGSKYVWSGDELDFMTEEELYKYNPNHDPQTGEFASASTNEMDSAEPSGQRADSRFTASRPLTKEERLGVGFYTATTGYREINAALRSGFSMANTPETEAHANNLAKAIDAHTLNEDITVYRGIRNDSLIGKINEGLLNDKAEFTDKGFPSTSFSQHVALEFTSQYQDSTHYMMRITVPKGAHALPASAMGLGARDEDEVILQHGSRFKVTARHDEGDQVVYDAHLVT